MGLFRFKFNASALLSILVKSIYFHCQIIVILSLWDVKSGGTERQAHKTIQIFVAVNKIYRWAGKQSVPDEWILAKLLLQQLACASDSIEIVGPEKGQLSEARRAWWMLGEVPATVCYPMLASAVFLTWQLSAG
jgi:hypothetical protein